MVGDYANTFTVYTQAPDNIRRAAEGGENEANHRFRAILSEKPFLLLAYR
ncbi:MAG: hypothetical protein LBP38_04925 [Desulfovibrio sp.]|jgi:hypothetical protein|nr:hypothetical protein [Desulfovibrio sp.]